MLTYYRIADEYKELLKFTILLATLRRNRIE